jgi:hypothetical protein
MDLIPALRQLLARVDYGISAGLTDSASPTGKVIVVKPARDSRRDASPVSTEADARTAPDVDAPAEPDADPQSKLAGIDAAALSRDGEALRKYLRDGDAAVQTAALDALAKQDKSVAVEGLLSEINDTSQPTRLQALQLLVQSADAGEETVKASLLNALKDSDPSFRAFAVQALSSRGDSDAINALKEAFPGSDASVRVMILESLAHTNAGPPLLQQALSDPDETVSKAAAALLHNEPATGETDPKP